MRPGIYIVVISYIILGLKQKSTNLVRLSISCMYMKTTALSLHNQFLGKTASIFSTGCWSNKHQKTATANQPERVPIPEIVTHISSLFYSLECCPAADIAVLLVQERESLYITEWIAILEMDKERLHFKQNFEIRYAPSALV